MSRNRTQNFPMEWSRRIFSWYVLRPSGHVMKASAALHAPRCVRWRCPNQCGHIGLAHACPRVGVAGSWLVLCARRWCVLVRLRVCVCVRARVCACVHGSCGVQHLRLAPWIMKFVAGYELVLTVLLLAWPHAGVFGVLLHGCAMRVAVTMNDAHWVRPLLFLSQRSW